MDLTRQAVITGIGIVSSLGNNATEVLDSLRACRSGIRAEPSYREKGFRCHVHGAIDVDLEALVPRRHRRFMGDGAAYNYIAMEQAIEDAGLDEERVSHPRSGIVMGSGGPSTSNQVEAADLLRAHKSTKKIGPFMVPRCMNSTNIASLATFFKIRGVNYSISSACSTSAHCVGHAAELIQFGKQDLVFAGGGEELHWSLSMLFDAMGAMSSKYNDRPAQASRAFDVDRDGFVISGGAAVLVIEELEHAQQRGAKIYARIEGYGATSDGFDIVQPSVEGGVRCIQQALSTVEGRIDYINAHGTSTPIGDVKEIAMLRQVFGDEIPFISSTKSLSGHALGAAGATELVYTLLMMQNGFAVESANIETLDPAIEGAPILRENRDMTIRRAMSNSFGFGGTNAVLVLCAP